MNRDKDVLPSNYYGSPEHPIELREVVATAKRSRPWYDKVAQWFNDEVFLNPGNIRAKNYRRAMDRNPNFSEDWDMASNISEGINVMSGGLLNRGSLSQNIGLIKDIKNGRSFMESWFGNNGIVPDQFIKKHPIFGTFINTAVDLPSLKFPTITRRGLYSGALINAGTDTGAGFLRGPFSKNALGYIVTGNQKYADRMIRRADGFPGGYAGSFISKSPGISKGNPHEVFFFPERFPNGSRVFNAGSGKGPRISSSVDNISEGNIQYFTENYPGREIRTVELFPGKDAVPFEQLKDFEYFGQYGYDGHVMAIPKVRGLYSGRSPYSFYDSGGTRVSIYRNPSDKSLYMLQEDAFKYLPKDYRGRYFNEPGEKILGNIVTPGLKALDAVGSPINVRGNIKKIPSSGVPLGFRSREFNINLRHIINGIQDGTIHPIQNKLQQSMDAWKVGQSGATLSSFPRNSLPSTPIIFPNTKTLLNSNEED